MKTKNILFLIFFLVLLFPLYAVFQILKLDPASGMEQATSALSLYQISLWVSWLIFVSIAVFYKWTRKSDLFFSIVYVFILLGFISFGYFTELAVTEYDLTTRFGEQFSLGVFSAIRNIIVSLGLTAFLQLAVFWFTRRWHRR